MGKMLFITGFKKIQLHFEKHTKKARYLCHGRNAKQEATEVCAEDGLVFCVATIIQQMEFSEANQNFHNLVTHWRHVTKISIKSFSYNMHDH